MDHFDQTSNWAPSLSEASREVRVTKTKSRTFIKTDCAVEGSIAFVRARDRAWSAWLARNFGLTPPAQVSEGVLAFGLNARLLAQLAQDESLVSAVAILVQSGQTLTLQAGGLSINIASKLLDSQLTEQLSAAIRMASARIEALSAGRANEYLGPQRLARPYGVAAMISAVALGLCLAGLEPTLTPLTLIGVSALLALALACVATFVIRSHLRKHALAGCAVSGVVALSLVTAVCTGGLSSVLCNTYGGEKLLRASRFHTSGNIVVKRVYRHTECRFNADDPTALRADGESFRSLPVSCSAVHFHSDSSDQSYEVDINPGLLGAPFVQAIHPDD